jgi:hypothetical protein
METMQINPIRTFEVVKNGQRVVLSVEEIRELAKSIDSGGKSVGSQPTRIARVGRAPTSGSKTKKTWGISQEKKDRILAHVRTRLSDSPQSLSKLLDGATYAPNDLPQLREYIEKQSDISRMTAGKLTYYFKSASKPQQETQVEAPAVTS